MGYFGNAPLDNDYALDYLWMLEERFISDFDFAETVGQRMAIIDTVLKLPNLDEFAKPRGIRKKIENWLRDRMIDGGGSEDEAMMIHTLSNLHVEVVVSNREIIKKFKETLPAID